MSVLTKVFVVLVSILSVLLVALIVPFVANTENYKRQLETAQSNTRRAEQSALLRQRELKVVQDKQSEWVVALESRNAQLEGQLVGLQDKLDQCQIQHQAQQAKIVAFEADWSRLTAANEQHAQINEQLQTELKARRDQVIDQQTKLIQLVDRNKELESQKDALTRQVRRIGERMTQLEERNADVEGKLAQLPPEWQAKLSSDPMTATPIIPSSPIKGQITGVDQLGVDTYVQVNVGSNDGVEENMKFLVHRGNQFLGTLIVTTVDTGRSAGRLDLMQGEVAVGDAVLTGGY